LPIEGFDPGHLLNWPAPTVTARILAFELVVTSHPASTFPFAPEPAHPLLTPLQSPTPPPTLGPIVAPWTRPDPADQQLMVTILGDIDDFGL
jgi:hypothetical protein